MNVVKKMELETVGLGQLCLKLSVLCYVGSSWNVIIMLPKDTALCWH